MQSQGRVLVGAGLVVAGLVVVVGSLLELDVGLLCLPTVLILLGAAILLRPFLAGPETAVRAAILGPVRRSGSWQVTEEEIWLGVGDVNLDLSEAEIPLGETTIRVFGFVGTTRLWVPEGIGVTVAPTAFLSTIRMMARKRDLFFSSARMMSDGYETAERKIRLETLFFVSDVRVKWAGE
jgi:hypothetical protein